MISTCMLRACTIVKKDTITVNAVQSTTSVTAAAAASMSKLVLATRSFGQKHF